MGLGRHVAVISAPADMILIVCEFVLSFPVILHLPVGVVVMFLLRLSGVSGSFGTATLRLKFVSV